MSSWCAARAERALLSLVCLSACAPKASKLEWSSPLPARVVNTRPVALPSVVVLDAKGQPLAEPPQVTVTVGPAQLAAIADGRLVAIGNGTAEVVATTADPPLRLATPVEVRAISKTELACEPSCSVKIGATVQIKVTSFAGDERIDEPCELGFIGTGFAAQGEGRFIATDTGQGTVRCRTGSVEIQSRPAIDSLAILCAHKAPAPAGKRPAGPEVCTIEDGRTLDLHAEGKAGGAVVSGVPVVWASSDPETAHVVDGKLTASRDGRVEITATADGQRAVLAFQVVPAVDVVCDGRGRRYKFTYMEPVDGENLSVTIACESQRSENCVEMKLGEDASLDEVKRVLAVCCCELEGFGDDE